MADLIENGFFNEDVLAPWQWCADNELGEAWICLEAEEPDFPRTRWVYTREGGVSDDAPLFLTEYNLALRSNDGVKQDLHGARADGDLRFYTDCQPVDRAWGTIYAFVCYTDHTFNYRKLAHSDLPRGPYPGVIRVPVEDKRIEKVVICVVDADIAPWYVTGITLPGAEARKGSGHGGRYASRLEGRVAALEKKVDRLYALLSRVPRPRRGEPPVKESDEVLVKT